MIKPTVGRKVWYWPSGLNRQPHDQPCDATVVYVHSERMVNLACFDSQGTPFARTSVPLLQDGDTATDVGAYAEWMPYQKGQARRDAETIETHQSPVS